MPNCENCGRQWKWKTIVLNTLKFTNKVNCPYCGKAQYIVPKSRKQNALFSFLPAFLIIVVTLIFDLEVLGTFLLVPALIFIFLGIYPFLTKLSNEDEASIGER
ncbi:TIGR04104 family putative zinc finger protein [Planococcus sp. SE5232]|uniref:TIGR04104 family putative zinc finger protein n=1 Tax=unclassified Planococcus (in: firmicutes) TaxID=2662419 RepID=UPI001CBDE921|nr:TIGR04104 family putative zinc finger protein [Planococcus sp. 4-30]